MIDRREFLSGLGSMGLLALLASCGVAPTSSFRAPPPPVAAYQTNWSRDEFALGSYSFLGIGGSPDDRAALAAPQGRLFFAGEATSLDHPSTVTGAHLSGLRAAEEVSAAVPSGSVAVVGAGAAGLTAADHLRRRGHDVVVLEGRDRIGGRIWSTSVGGVVTDLGASWIHGTRGNPLTALARDLGSSLAPTDYDRIRVEYDDGRLVSGSALAGANSLERALGAVIESSPLSSSVLDALFEAGFDPTDPVQAFYVDAEIRSSLAEEPERLGVASLWEGQTFPGGDAILPDGYLRLFEAMTDGMDVRLGTVVDRIDHGPDGVTIGSGTTSFDADAALVTLPVGVLQAGSVAITPGLSDAKRAALGRIGMGVLDKTVLVFEDVWWDPDPHVFGLASSGADTGWAWWLNVAAHTGDPVLIGFNGGDRARRHAATDHDTTIALATDVVGGLLRAEGT